jgi:hypothetical protein
MPDIIDVCLDNEPPSKVFALFSGRPLDGLGSIAVQRSIDDVTKSFCQSTK